MIACVSLVACDLTVLCVAVHLIGLAVVDKRFLISSDCSIEFLVFDELSVSKLIFLHG